MMEDIKIKQDCDKEISQIEETIKTYKKELTQLIAQRQMLLSKKKHMDMDLVLEYIIEQGLSANEVLELISGSLKKAQ